MLSFLSRFAQTLGFPWGFAILLLGLGALALLLARVGSWSCLCLSFVVISWQRDKRMAPSQIQYGLETVLDRVPAYTRHFLKWLTILFFLWLLLFLLRTYLPFERLRQVERLFTGEARSLFHWLCAALV